ncbi:MAG TPA: hypothetical protein VKD91_09480, partial [Pyrinomonadaceae bacterium]|nr:hypothetical protein [Pyrinomonadaceae bacterium]
MIEPRILASVNRDRFFGRAAELREIVRHSSAVNDLRSLVVMAGPDAGAPELLRQAYDRLFMRRGDPVPIHFAFRRSDSSPVETARRLFQSLLQQYTAYRRVNPSLCKGTLTFNDLLELALPGDYELIANLIEAFQREQASEVDFINFCFGVPERLGAAGRAIYLLIDCTAVGPFREDTTPGHRFALKLANSEVRFVLAGLRRQANDLIHGTDDLGWEAASIIHLDRLSDGAATELVESLARHYGIVSSEPTRDLIVQQLDASPLFLTDFMHAARRRETRLNSFLACQRLYVDELLGGSIKRRFDRMLEAIAPNRQTSKTLLKILYESAMSDTRRSSLWTWKKRLGLATPEFERVIDALHSCELVNSSAALIEVNSDSYVWMDYLRAHYRVEVAAEARARVVASTLLETLERAPQTMTRKYRREAAAGLRDLLPLFNCQQVPAALLHYDRFAAAYKGEDSDDIEDKLEAETDLVQLPQVIQTASCTSYSNTIGCERERCIVAHAFETGEYTEANEVVWLAAEIDSKLEADAELTEEWCDRL